MHHWVSQVNSGQETLQCEAPQGPCRANTHHHLSWHLTISHSLKRWKKNQHEGRVTTRFSPLISFASAFAKRKVVSASERERERERTARTLQLASPFLLGLKSDTLQSCCRKTSVGIKVEVWTKLSDARQRELLAPVSWLPVRPQYHLCWSNSNKTNHTDSCSTCSKLPWPDTTGSELFTHLLALKLHFCHKKANIFFSQEMMFTCKTECCFFSEKNPKKEFLHSSGPFFIQILGFQLSSTFFVYPDIWMANKDEAVWLQWSKHGSKHRHQQWVSQIPRWVIHWEYGRRRRPNYYSASQSTSALSW